MVTDFGVAKAISESTGQSSLTSAGVALGTPAYMAPEQAAGSAHLDHRADVYALGVMAHELLAGQPPFTGSAQVVLAAHVGRRPEPLLQRRAAVPPTLAALVMQCLEKRAADRWQSAAELHALLDGMATPSGGTTPIAAWPATLRSLGRRRIRVMAAVLVVAVATARGDVHAAPVLVRFLGSEDALRAPVWARAADCGITRWLFGPPTCTIERP